MAASVSPMAHLPVKSQFSSGRANGSANKGRVHQESPTIWPSISKHLPSRNEQDDYWWNFSGPQLATLVAQAGYTLQEQYETLMFHYHHVVPYLGGIPKATGPTWTTLLTNDGSTFEYSWRWPGVPVSNDGPPPPAATKKPDIRVAMEAMSPHAGTLADPLNIQPTIDLLTSVQKQHPSTVDLTLFHYFNSVFYDLADTKQYLDPGERPTGTSLCCGFDYLHGGRDPLPKVYWAPRRPRQPGLFPLDAWEAALRGSGAPAPGLPRLFDFIRNEAPRLGVAVHPFMLSVDCVALERSRLKLYVQTDRTSLSFLRSMMTLGGTVNAHADAAFDKIIDVVERILPLPEGQRYTDDEEVPRAPAYNPSRDGTRDPFKGGLLSSFSYYYDLSLDPPDVKMYIPTHFYAGTDRDVMDGVAGWFQESRGTTEDWADGFYKSLAAVQTHRRPEDGAGMMAYTSLMIKDGCIDTTNYIMPEMYHPARFAKKNSG